MKNGESTLFNRPIWKDLAKPKHGMPQLSKSLKVTLRHASRLHMSRIFSQRIGTCLLYDGRVVAKPLLLIITQRASMPHFSQVVFTFQGREADKITKEEMSTCQRAFGNIERRDGTLGAKRRTSCCESSVQ